jgi:hypothetical protein
VNWPSDGIEIGEGTSQLNASPTLHDNETFEVNPPVVKTVHKCVAVSGSSSHSMHSDFKSNTKIFVWHVISKSGCSTGDAGVQSLAGPKQL